MNRRKFISVSALATPAVALSNSSGKKSHEKKSAIVISTWEQNIKANTAAWKILQSNGKALDAVHAGVMVPEADPADQSVGYGGLPDRDGKVTLDACIMDGKGNCGSVMALEHIVHAISVARLVMQNTPHVALAGAGALQFALENGFKKENLLTPESETKWKEWKLTNKYDPMDTIDNIRKNIENQHDTIGMLAVDNAGEFAGACTTSGLAYKMHGRVGDSPIIGAGLYVDEKAGAATSTGMGEEVIRIVGSHTVVELMRNGMNPEEACKKAVGRLVKLKGEDKAKELQVGFIALDRLGNYGCYSLIPGFSMAVRTAEGEQIIQSKSWFS